DHAPHTAEHKCSEWTAAAMGMVGMESALPIVVRAMADHDFDFGDLARVMSAAPARITGASGHGSLEMERVRTSPSSTRRPRTPTHRPTTPRRGATTP